MMISDEMVDIKKELSQNICNSSWGRWNQAITYGNHQSFESDLENKIFNYQNTQHLQGCTKSALDAIAFNDFRRDAHWRYNSRKFI
jgi:hypothetical protein